MQTEAAGTLIAVFDDYNSAERAVRELEAEGVPRTEIDLRSNHKTAGAGSYSDSGANEHHEGGFGAWLRNLFGGDSDDNNHEHYDEALRRGNAVVSVAPLEGTVDIDRVASILNQNGAVDIDQRVEAWKQSGYSGYDPAAEPYTYDQASRERDRFKNTETSGPVPVIEEELQVGKRVVRKGGVRVYSQVIDRPVEEQINLREERVRVERRPANRPASEAELGNLRDQTIEVTEMAEEPVISKRARVTEEVYVGKEATERMETIRDNVRSTQVKVDSLDDSAQDYSNDAAYQYGYRSAGDARFKGKSWTEAEQDLQSGYMGTNPSTAWDEAKSKIRLGWDKVAGR